MPLQTIPTLATSSLPALPPIGDGNAAVTAIPATSAVSAMGAVVAGITLLPAELIERIGSLLPGRALLNLAATCRDNQRALQAEIAWRRLVYGAERVDTPAAVQHILHAAQASPRRLADKAYRALAARLPDMPEPYRNQAAALVFDAATRGPVAKAVRTAIGMLTVLRQPDLPPRGPLALELEHWLHEAIRRLPPRERGAAMVPYLSVVSNLPVDCYATRYWTDMLSAVPAREAAATLAEASRWLLAMPYGRSLPQHCAEWVTDFNTLLGTARALAAHDDTALKERVRLLSRLTEHLMGFALRAGSQHTVALWHALFAEVRPLPAMCRTPLLCRLASLLECCSGGLTRIRHQWTMLLGATADLPASLRAVALHALAEALFHATWLVGDVGDAGSQSGAGGDIAGPGDPIAAQCHRLLDEAATLPMPERSAVCHAVSDVADDLLRGTGPGAEVSERLRQLQG